MEEKTKKIIKLIFIITGVSIIVLITIFQSMNLDLNTDYKAGVTFSRPYAEELGVEPDLALQAALDDLGVRHFRVPAYWNMIQPSKYYWDFGWLDQDLDAIAERGGKVTLAIGHKLPRWPECWTPTWARSYSQDELETAVKLYLKEVVTRYKDHPAVEAYQVENEPNFPFGICPEIREDFIDEEIAYVRELDHSKPIATTDSGELTLWGLGGKVERLGVSVYRVVKSPIGIFRYWFVPPQLYLRKGQVAKFFYGTDQIYISEFQMEPWVDTTIPEASLEEQFQTFDLRQMQKNIAYAKKMGLPRIDFWGVEWWYYMKEVHNKPEFWEESKNIFNNQDQD
ncbi:cellulase family glycosylhydrolase [Candidatus Uhrbacteria bacterium]|nr:cellulase family glycosylhydrolase [Candidatus Uhrbacteria bacterium]